MSARARCWRTAVMVVALVVVWAPEALACSVCFDANGERRAAFLATTIFLTLTPLAFVFAVVWWLRRRARDLDVIPPAE